MCIFSSILNHRQANQKNSIIKGWQQVEILNVFFFCHQKTIKNRQALHEIIGALSLSIFFVEFSVKLVYLTLVVEILKFMENYNAWETYLQVKILALDIVTHMLPPIPSIPPIALAVKTLQVLSSPLRWPWPEILGYLHFIWFVIFSNVMTLQFCKQNIYHIA